MAVAMIGPKFYAWDRNGKPLAFGKLYTYQARTNTPKPTYQSEDQVVENANPVILNGEGYANVYLDGSYKMVLKDKDDNEIWSSDPVTSAQPEEWVNCFSASYVDTKTVKISGNQTDEYREGRKVRVDNNLPEYSFSEVVSASYAAGETSVELLDSVVTTGIVGICTSIISPDSSFNKADASRIIEAGDQQIVCGSIYPADATKSAGTGESITDVSFLRVEGVLIALYGGPYTGLITALTEKNDSYAVSIDGIEVVSQKAAARSISDSSSYSTINDAILDGYSAVYSEDGEITYISPLNNMRFRGDKGAIITVPEGMVAFSPTESDHFKYTLMSGIRAQGQGKVADDTRFIDYVGAYNHAFNTLIGARLSGFDTCINFSAGWGNTSIGVDCRGSINGIKYTTSPIQPGWSGSGQLSLASSYQYNDNGIYEFGTPWMNTYINTILEGNELGILAQGNNTVMISPWFEINTKDIQIERGITIIGGRRPTWDAADVSLFNESEMVSMLDGSSFTLTRGLPDGSDAVVHANGSGVKKLQGAEVAISTQDEKLRVGASAFTQPGDVTGMNYALHGAYFPSRIIDKYDDTQESKIIDVKFNAIRSAGGTGSAFGELEVEVNQYENVGISQQSTPMALKLNKLSTGGDAVNDLGEPTHRFNNSYFAVAPTVGSDARIKDTPESIPQELCDLALTTEIKQYKLKTNTSGRNHYGIIIDEEFLSKIRSATDLDKCGAFCQSVFTDSNGEPISRHIGGDTYLLNGVDNGKSYVYEIKNNTCEIQLNGNIISVLDGNIVSVVDGIELFEGKLYDSLARDNAYNKQLSLAEKEMSELKDSLSSLSSKRTSLISEIEKIGDPESKDESEKLLRLKEDLALSESGIVKASDSISEGLKIKEVPKTQQAKGTDGGVRLGDFWQVRYDEWQNIMLEAIRRKLTSV